jgi:hypothetical protein
MSKSKSNKKVKTTVVAEQSDVEQPVTVAVEQPVTVAVEQPVTVVVEQTAGAVAVEQTAGAVVDSKVKKSRKKVKQVEEVKQTEEVKHTEELKVEVEEVKQADEDKVGGENVKAPKTPKAKTLKAKVPKAKVVKAKAVKAKVSKSSKEKENVDESEKVKATIDVDDDENVADVDETSDRRVRSFKVKLPDNTDYEGRFTGLTPYQAANKALSKYFREGKKDLNTEISFCICESTRKSKKHVYTYTGSRVQLATPVKYTIQDGREIVKNFKNNLKKVKKADVKIEAATATATA